MNIKHSDMPKHPASPRAELFYSWWEQASSPCLRADFRALRTRRAAACTAALLPVAKYCFP